RKRRKRRPVRNQFAVRHKGSAYTTTNKEKRADEHQKALLDECKESTRATEGTSNLNNVKEQTEYVRNLPHVFILRTSTREKHGDSGKTKVPGCVCVRYVAASYVFEEVDVEVACTSSLTTDVLQSYSPTTPTVHRTTRQLPCLRVVSTFKRVLHGNPTIGGTLLGFRFATTTFDDLLSRPLPQSRTSRLRSSLSLVFRSSQDVTLYCLSEAYSDIRQARVEKVKRKVHRVAHDNTPRTTKQHYVKIPHTKVPL
ncbi:hypothetical protein U1Q18_045855, partial [Sarracenia purpurea var. burkii]